jgi:hypothetical protein
MTLPNKKVDIAANAGTDAAPKADHFNAIVMVLAIVLVIGFFASGKLTRGNETRAVFDAMVQTRGCVVADIKNRVPSRYRCDYPVAGQYIDASVMMDEAERVVDARYAKK